MTEYDNFAKYYDFYYKDRQKDIPFWIKLAKKISGTILEIGCGTGRLTLPMAKAGINIIGIDVSKEMLSRAKSIIRKEKLQNRVKFHQVNIKDYNFGRKFNFIFSPWGFYYYKKRDQIKVLLNNKKKISSKGTFCLDVYNYNQDPILSNTRLVLEPPVYVGKEHKNLLFITRIMARDFIPKSNLDKIFNYYLAINKNKDIRIIKNTRTEFRFNNKYCRDLLKYCGFKITKSYGDYNFKNISRFSPRLIYLCVPKISS